MLGFLRHPNGPAPKLSLVRFNPISSYRLNDMFHVVFLHSCFQSQQVVFLGIRFKTCRYGKTPRSPREIRGKGEKHTVGMRPFVQGDRNADIGELQNPAIDHLSIPNRVKRPQPLRGRNDEPPMQGMGQIKEDHVNVVEFAAPEQIISDSALVHSPD